MSLSRVRMILWGLVVAVGIAATLFTVYQQTQPKRSQTVHFGGDFTLQQASGGEFTQADFSGKPTMLFFGYTFCPDVCPTTLFESTNWRKELGLTGEDIRIVFVSVDPERDTPEQLATYLSSFGDDLIGLTGTPEQVDHVKKTFGIFGERVESEGASDYLVNHTATLFLLDKTGDLFGTIGFGEAKDSAVAKLKRLMANNG
ncbi:SCO family protein [Maritalea sp.]|uniref:SCO family protein n=1 Tax=Maritalea sp. TaxID=2003361 RepID=UPI003EF54BFC